ncbi:MAG: DsbA oxidoreductase [uncultured bacterium]|nr:MAG: DsbA oxidoreductase [uncultured bacterium]
MSKSTPIYFFTAVSVFALLFLVLAVWLIKASWLNELFIVNTLTSDQVNAHSGIVIDDPLITTVPEDQQGSEQKTKVFVSSADPLLGENTAKVYVIFYGSLYDGDMSNYLAMITNLDAAYGDEVAFVWKDNPTGETDKLAAEVAHCTNEYNKFWEFTTALSNRADDSEEALIAVAEGLGMDGQTLRDCVKTSGYAGQITQSQATAGTLAVTNNHVVFINDRLFTELIDETTIKQNIDEILATF